MKPIPDSMPVNEKLGDYLRVQSGFAFKSRDFVDYGTPVIRISNIQDGTIDISSTVRVNFDLPIEDFRVKEGDSLVAMSGATTGKTGVYRDKETAYVNQRVGKFIIQNEDKLDAGFLAQYVGSLLFKLQLRGYLEQGAQPNISGKQIQNFSIPLFPINEQKVIAEALSEVDSLIGNLEELLEKQKSIFIAVSETLLAATPSSAEDLNPICLGDFGYFYGGLSGKSGADFTDAGSKYINFLNVINNVFADEDGINFVTIRSSEVQNRVKEGDLLLNGSSETPEEVGFASYVPRALEGSYLNSFCFGFRFNKLNELDSKFFAYLSRSSQGRKIIAPLAQGSTRYNLSKRALSRSIWYVPNHDRQLEIVEILNSLRQEMSSLQAERDKYVCIKEGMMHDLLTGKVRLL